MCDLQGRVLRRWEMKDRVNDLALIPEADVIVCVTADRYIQLMRLSDHVPVSRSCRRSDTQSVHGNGRPVTQPTFAGFSGDEHRRRSDGRAECDHEYQPDARWGVPAGEPTQSHRAPVEGWPDGAADSEATSGSFPRRAVWTSTGRSASHSKITSSRLGL